MAYTDGLRYDSIATLSSRSQLSWPGGYILSVFTGIHNPALVRYDSRGLEEEGAPYPKITVLSVNARGLDKEKGPYQS
jgi:hypothetical protein